MTIVYLSGGIRKYRGIDLNHGEYWTDQMIADIKNIGNMTILDPSVREQDLSNEMAIFGRDLLQVSVADAIIVDARHRRGIGIGYEIAFANLLNIPVLTLLPLDSHYSPSEIQINGQKIHGWTHPFLSVTSDTYPDLPSLIPAIETLPEHRLKKNMITQRVGLAILEYCQNSLKKDSVMTKLIATSPELKNRINDLYLDLIVRFKYVQNVKHKQ